MIERERFVVVLKLNDLKVPKDLDELLDGNTVELRLLREPKRLLELEFAKLKMFEKS